MKVVGALRKICRECKLVVRGRKKGFILCPRSPRHKQRQGREKNPFGIK